MPFGTQQSGPSSSKQWPDFYSILESTPETDMESVRRSINTLYVKANEQSDHRELSTRFYNQVLSQKVLPQCRRILLNETSREAYNQQWHLHRDGAKNALSYQDFIRELTKGSGTAGALLLSDDEISLLPSFHSERSDPPAALTPHAPQSRPTLSEPLTEVVEAEEVTEATPVKEAAAWSPHHPMVAQAQVLAVPRPTVPAPRKKGFPIAGALAALALIGGGLAYNATRQSNSPAPAPALAPASPIEAPAPFLKLNSLALNSDFELGARNWELANKQAYVEGKQTGARSGTNVLTFWGSKPYQTGAFQTVKGLQPGLYTLRTWVRRTGGQKQAQLIAKDFGGAPRSTTMPSTRSWASIALNDIKVTANQCTIGFETQGESGKFTKVDAVEFHKQ